jgi:hypothetical protein
MYTSDVTSRQRCPVTSYGTTSQGHHKRGIKSDTTADMITKNARHTFNIDKIERGAKISRPMHD